MLKGYILDNKYEVIDILGSGGMGTVYLVKHLKLGSLWAVKKLKKLSDNLNNILTEVDVLKNLDHTALPKVIDVIEEIDSFYIVFTYLKGDTLSQRIDNNGRFSESEAINIALSICDVLNYLHSRKPLPIIYRDLKPSNIILCEDGLIKLIDFGTAREFKEENTQDTIFIGTKGYAAPEQYGEGQSGPYTDIYSLGVTIKQLVTGKNPLSPPYGIQPVRQLMPHLSKDLEQLLEKCTHNEIDKRYQYITDLVNDLNSLNKNFRSNYSKNKKDVIIKTEKKVFFKQIIISLDNSEFTSELAIAATNTEVKVLLVDISRFTPVCDFYLGIKKQYNEFCVINEIDNRGLTRIENNLEEIDKCIFKIPKFKDLYYLAIAVDGLNNENIIDTINKFKENYDFIFINTSINFLDSNKHKLFLSVDKILIANRVYLGYFDYWKRNISSVLCNYNLRNIKIIYLGWQYKKEEVELLRITNDLSKELDFIEGIPFKASRYYNVNNSKSPAFVNYKECENEYKKLLFYLNVSPIAYANDCNKGFLDTLLRRRS